MAAMIHDAEVIITKFILREVMTSLSSPVLGAHLWVAVTQTVRAFAGIGAASNLEAGACDSFVV